MARPEALAFYEFFAGGGLARLGLSPAFACVFANDHDPAKAAAYTRAFGADVLREGDVEALGPADLPGRAALAWASFPCQDLSLAGARAGLDAPRSGAFWAFHHLMRALAAERRAPRVICLENVTGLLTSRRGADFERLVAALDELGYRCGAVEIDASHFVPQSRRRLFVIAARSLHPTLVAPRPDAFFHSDGVQAAVRRLPATLQRKVVWWRLPVPPLRNAALADLIDEREASWRSDSETQKLIRQMSPLQRERLEALRASGGVHIGAVFRRMRVENGVKVQRAEARFDGLAGCLRTPAGGSSRQILIEIRAGRVRTRLFNGREAARLMGVGDDHPIPDDRTQALHLFGDAVVVPVVRWLADHLLLPLARDGERAREDAA